MDLTLFYLKLYCLQLQVVFKNKTLATCFNATFSSILSYSKEEGERRKGDSYSLIMFLSYFLELDGINSSILTPLQLAVITLKMEGKLILTPTVPLI